MARAVIICPSESARWYQHWMTMCVDYCRQQGYETVGVTEDWQGARRMLDAHEAEVIVVAKREHLPKSSGPRLEVIAEQR
jgi:hypothetical protein